MKKHSLITIISLFLVSPSAVFANGGNLSLKGTINGYEGSYIHLIRQEGAAMLDDSTKIENGSFAFTTALSEQMIPGGLLIGSLQDRTNTKFCNLYLEPKAMTVKIDKDNFSRPTVSGSQSQADNDSVNLLQDSYVAEMDAARKEMRDCQEEARLAELESKVDASRYKAIQATISWIRQHPASLIAPMQLRMYTGNMTYEEIKAIYDSFTPEVKSLSAANEIKAELATLQSVQAGNLAPVFRAKNWKGEEEGIADLRGKYVILDFWATWCVPCRKSFPHVKSLYEKYADKGLDVFCVADDDSNPSQWKAAIEKDGIQKFHHVLRGYVRGSDNPNDISNMYDVHYLPTKFLIDKEGRMIGKFDDGELDTKLKEIFGF